MKQLILPLAATTAIVGCQAAPTNEHVPTTPVLKVNQADANGSIGTLTVDGVSFEKQIPAKKDSKVVRSNMPQSNEPYGSTWYKKRSMTEVTTEQTSLVTNHHLGVPQARLHGLDGSGVTVSVVDTGIHDKSRFKDKDIFVANTESVQDKDTYHGDRVAQIIADRQEGIAPNVELIDAQHKKTSWSVQNAVNNSAPHAHIINHSGSYTQFNADDSNGRAMAGHAEAVLKKAINEHGILYVQSTGNEGRNHPNAEVWVVKDNPVLQKGYIAVTASRSATDATLGETRNGERWANYCGVAADFCMTAPGYYVVPEGKDRARVFGGTSYAAPRVTAAAALVKQKFPWASNDVLRTSLLTTATDLGDRKKYGWGMLNIEKAVKGPASLPFGRLTVDVHGVSEFSNNIDGTGSLYKTGSGTLNLDGLTIYTGGTTIKSGTLNINNVHTGFVDVDGGTLGGEGIVYTANVQRGTLDLQNGLDAYNMFLSDKSVTKVQAEKTSHIHGKAILDGKLVVASQPETSLSKRTMNFTALDVQQGYTGKFDSVSTPLAYTAKAEYKNNGVDIAMSRKTAGEMSHTVNHSTAISPTVSQSARNADELMGKQFDKVGVQLKNQLARLYSTSDEAVFAQNLYTLGTSVQANSLGYNTIDTMSLAHQAADNLLDRISNENFGKTDGLHGIVTTSVTDREHSPDDRTVGSHKNQISGLGASYHQGDFGVLLQATYGKSNWDENYAGSKVGGVNSVSKGLHLVTAKNMGAMSLYANLSGVKITGEIDSSNQVFDKYTDATVLSMGAGVKKAIGNNIDVNFGGRVDVTKVDKLNTIDGQDYLDLTSNDKTNKTPVMNFGVGVHTTLPILNNTKVNANANIEYDTINRLNNLGAWQDNRLRSKVAIGAEPNKAGKLQPAISLAYHNSKAENTVSGSVSLRF